MTTSASNGDDDLNEILGTIKSIAERGIDRYDSGIPERTYRARKAENELNRRRLRHRIIGHSEIFGEPAWDILLDLYVNEAKESEVSVSSACLASLSPSSTALRWIRHLENVGLIMRTPDKADGRRYFLTLTAKARNAIERYLAHRP